VTPSMTPAIAEIATAPRGTGITGQAFTAGEMKECSRESDRRREEPAAACAGCAQRTGIANCFNRALQGRDCCEPGFLGRIQGTYPCICRGRATFRRGWEANAGDATCRPFFDLLEKARTRGYRCARCWGTGFSVISTPYPDGTGTYGAASSVNSICWLRAVIPGTVIRIVDRKSYLSAL